MYRVPCRLLLLAAVAACGQGADAPAPAAPDLIAFGTVQPGGTEAAVVVRDGRIAQVLAPAEGRALAGPDTRILEGQYVTAGFVDAHAHLIALGRSQSELSIAPDTTYAATLDAVAAAVPEQGWLTGRGWDQNDWPDAPEGGWPTAADLDARVGDTPVALRRIDGHALWVNSPVLRAAGIDATTPDPSGGRILRDAAGNPSGVLIDEAMALVQPPAPSEAAVAGWIRTGTASAHQVGLTGVHLMGIDDADLAVLQRQEGLGLRLRVYVAPDSKAAERLKAEGPWGDEWLRVVGVKDFGDGALGSRGAWLSADYADEPGRRGLPMISDADLTAEATALLGAGAQLAVHAIGDAAVTQALDAFEAARAAHPDRADVPLRIEHAQVVRPEDRMRFATLGVIASMQPTHATSDMPWAPARLGPERTGWAYTWHSLQEAGALLAFGSDFPIESPDPGAGLWAATTRMDPKGQPPGGWLPDEAVSLDAAIAGFTSGAAAAVVEADDFGTVEPTKAADLTLWKVEAGRWVATATIVGGEVQWQR